MPIAKINSLNITTKCVAPQKKTIVTRFTLYQPSHTFKKIHTTKSSHTLFELVQPRIQKKWVQTTKSQDDEPATYIPEDVATLQSRMSQYRPIESPRTPPRPNLLGRGGLSRGIGKEKSIEPPIPEYREPKIITFKRDGVEVQSSVGKGGRKTSHASVRIVTPPQKDGELRINRRSFTSYFPQMQLRDLVLQPLLVTEKIGQFDIACHVTGGGITGQAGAIRHAIANALQNFDPELRPALKLAGLLTRDNRQVERKKPGKAGARRSFQWVKR